ncbi:hypothetical protein, partial [Priestia megaterium]|uniref:hypothetical protein n=1 Tax=Priestia megaterium TaxID=1404 RepID=UPI00366B3F60
NKTKQPVTCTISATGRLKGVLIPVSKTGVSPYLFGFFIMICYGTRRRIFTDTLFYAYLIRQV